MSALTVCGRFGPGNYHKYRLWQACIPWREKRGYWHDQKYYAFLDRVNPYSYRIMARNKVVAKALLRFYGIPDAEYVAYLSRHGCVPAGGSSIEDLESLERLLEVNTTLTRLCFKPVEGSGGAGFCAADIIRGRRLCLSNLRDGELLSVPEYVDKCLGGCNKSDYIVETYLEQHPSLAMFNPTSLNTLRVWVGRSAGGSVEIVGMFLRVGRAGSLVDNSMAGGFGVEVDSTSFRTQRAITQDGVGRVFSLHPDSGFDMSDRQLPFKESVCILCKQIMGILPATRFVGLDIAFTPQRPVVIEFNLAPTAIGACVLGKSHASLLGWIENDI
jgi:hypothetical protein